MPVRDMETASPTLSATTASPSPNLFRRPPSVKAWLEGLQSTCQTMTARPIAHELANRLRCRKLPYASPKDAVFTQGSNESATPKYCINARTVFSRGAATQAKHAAFHKPLRVMGAAATRPTKIATLDTKINAGCTVEIGGAAKGFSQGTATRTAATATVSDNLLG